MRLAKRRRGRRGVYGLVGWGSQGEGWREGGRGLGESGRRAGVEEEGGERRAYSVVRRVINCAEARVHCHVLGERSGEVGLGDVRHRWLRALLGQRRWRRLHGALARALAALERRRYFFVLRHETDVREVAEEQQQSFPPLDLPVEQEQHEHDD